MITKNEGFLRLSEAPFLKYLIPFVVGIILQTVFEGGVIIALSVLFVSTIFFYLYYSAKLSKTKFVRRKYFGYAIFTLFVSLGVFDANISSNSFRSTLPEVDDYAIAHILETTEKEKSFECKSKIIKFGGIEENISDFNAILYIQKDSLSETLSKDDILIFEQNLQPIKFSKNPYSIDYSSILEKQGFCYSQYLTSNSWRKIDKVKDNSFLTKSQKIKNKFIDAINNIQISDNSKMLIRAMLLGDTSLISKDTRNYYSSSGLSHILAVSGLHIGIIAFILYLLLYPLKWIKLSYVRPLVTLLTLWGYTYIIGFPPSAVRATIMASFVLLGEIINRKGTTINSLFAAALFMLVYNPNNLFNVGFQLSFTAVFSIFYIYPFIYRLLPNNNKFTSYIASLVAVTVAAQIGTLPLSIYYFNQLPLIGIISNLFVIPFLPFVLGVSILALIINILFLNKIVDISFSYIDFIANLTNLIPYASINDIHIEGYYLVFIYILIFGGIWALKNRNSKLVVMLLSFVTIFCIVEFFVIDDPKKCKTVVYDDNKITALNFIDDKYNYIIAIDTANIANKVEYMAKNLWIREATPEAIYKQDSIFEDNLYVTLPYISYKGDKYLILNNNYFKYHKLSEGKRLFINKAIICEGFSGSLLNLTNMFIFEEIIIASNLNHFKRNSIIKECKTLKIPYYNIKEKGAYILYE